MKTLFKKMFVSLAFILVMAGLGCSGSPRFLSVSDLPSMNVNDLTPIEVKRLERVLNNEVSPCGDDITLAQALLNTEHCPLASMAGSFVIKKIKEDFNEQEISSAYVARFAAIKGLEIAVDGSPVIGAEKPQVTLVVFTDFECPYCAKCAQQLHELLRRYQDKIALVHKNYPLSIHDKAEYLAKAAYAAHRQDKFWEMHDTIFSTVGIKLDEEKVKVMALGLGLDVEKFEEDLDSPAAIAAITADKKLGEQLGVGGTPTIFVNGRLFDEGLAGLEKRINEEFMRFK